jgi:hypothetical protein
VISVGDFQSVISIDNFSRCFQSPPLPISKHPKLGHVAPPKKSRCLQIETSKIALFGGFDWLI